MVWEQNYVDLDAYCEGSKFIIIWIHSQKPLVLWFTGLSASGKSTIANLVHTKLNNYKKKSYLLDGDNLRHGLCSDLTFSYADRKENIRRTKKNLETKTANTFAANRHSKRDT